MSVYSSIQKLQTKIEFQIKNLYDNSEYRKSKGENSSPLTELQTHELYAV
jgi:hypothetical protein